MKKKLKKIPVFKSEKEERLFWEKADSTEYVDYSRAYRMQFPNLKLTSKPITIRLPVILLDKIKVKAHKLDIPYQSYIKQLIANAI
jgi:predicted DNA binding CopG/RHH family protein